MRQAAVATLLLVMFGAPVTLPRNLTPIPVAHGIRECGVDYECLKHCHGNAAACQNQCRLPCRR
jgi:hypothetical protein